MDQLFTGISTGLSTALTPANIVYALLGCGAGTIIGMLPGLGPMTAIALMIPVTMALEPASGMILLAGVYYGAIFGGSTSSILINAPGVAGTVATSFDGHPLARSGEPGPALAIAALASFGGGTLGAILLLMLAPMLAALALSFQSADYFALMVLGLVSVAAFSTTDDNRVDGLLKGLIATVLGMMLATVGTDSTSGVPRYTFGRLDLVDGISFLLLAMATFAMSEAFMMAVRPPAAGERQHITGLTIPLRRVTRLLATVGRASGLGFVIGILPGAGRATVASFLAYAAERLTGARAGERAFGEGNDRGLAAPEAANNAACTGSFVPMLTLGIPGSGTTAILLGALLAYGITPGPLLVRDAPEVFWSVIVSMYLGNLFLLRLNLPLIPVLARLLTLGRAWLTGIILFFSAVGVYLVSFNTFDLWLMVLFALCAFGLRLANWPLAPMLLGFILGGMFEANLRRALTLSDGSPAFLWERPSTIIILAIAFLVVAMPPVLQALRSGGAPADPAS